MYILNFNKNGIKMTFGIDGAKRLLLLGVSVGKERILPENRLFSAVELHSSGANQNDAHGAKHTGGDELYYVSHTETDREIRFILQNELLKVTAVYEFFDGLKVFRAYTEVENISARDVGLEYVASVCLYGLKAENIYVPHNGWFRELNWKKYSLPELGLTRINPNSTKRISASTSGTHSTKEYIPMALIEEKEQNILFQIEHNGSWTWEISDVSNEVYLKASGPCEQENHWWKKLHPGEIFTSVKAAVCIYDGDISATFAEMTKYRRLIAYRSPADKKLPVIFNDYMGCIWAEPTTEKELPVIEAAAKAGAEYYVMDAGWYANGTWWSTVGEWRVYEPRFPGGLKAVFDRVRELGMIPGIWVEPEVMGVNSPIAKYFPDDCFFVRHGRKVADHGRYQFDFRNPKVREYLDSVVDRLINDYGIGYFKFDYNIDGGIGTEIDADSFGDGLMQCNAAFLSWIDGLYERHPDLVIENCSSGGLRMEYASLAHFSIQSLTDAETCERVAPIAAVSQTGVIPEQAAVWCVPKNDGSPEDIAVNMVSAMFRRVHLSGETPWLDDSRFALVREGIDFYKATRELIPEMTAFYPMGICTFSNDWQVVGFEGGGKKYLCVTRLNGANELEIPLDFTVSDVNIVYPKSSKADITLCGDTLKVAFKTRNAVVLELI